VSAGVPPAPDRSWPARVLENPGAAIYGLITVGAVLAAESTQRETYAKTLAAAVVAGTLYWLAHAYASLLGSRLQEGTRLSAGALVGVMRVEAPLLVGAAVPVLVLALCWALGSSLAVGTGAAVWVSAAVVAVAELWSGARAGAAGLELLLEAGTGALLGALLIALKVLLH
jgi:hypothetical protein